MRNRNDLDLGDQLSDALKTAIVIAILDRILDKYLNIAKKYFDNKIIALPVSVSNETIRKIKNETSGIETPKSFIDLISFTPSDAEYANKIQQSDTGKIRRMVSKDHSKSTSRKLLNLLRSAYKKDTLLYGKELSNYFLISGFHLFILPSRDAYMQRSNIKRRDKCAKAIACLSLISLLTKNELTNGERNDMQEIVIELLTTHKIFDPRALNYMNIRDQVATLQLIDEILKSLPKTSKLYTEFQADGKQILKGLIKNPFVNKCRWDEEALDNIDKLSDRISGTLLDEYQCIVHYISYSKHIIADEESRTEQMQLVIQELIELNAKMIEAPIYLSIDPVLTKSSIQASMHLFQKNPKWATPEEMQKLIQQMQTLEKNTAPDGIYHSISAQVSRKLSEKQNSDASANFISLAIFAYFMERVIEYFETGEIDQDNRKYNDILLVLGFTVVLFKIIQSIHKMIFIPSIKIIPLHFDRPEWLPEFERKYHEKIAKDQAQKLRAENRANNQFVYVPSATYENPNTQPLPVVELEEVDLGSEFNAVKAKLEEMVKQTKNLFMKKTGSKHIVYEAISSRFANDPLAFYDQDGKFDRSKLSKLIVRELEKMQTENKKSEPIDFNLAAIINVEDEVEPVTPPMVQTQQLVLENPVRTMVQKAQKQSAQEVGSSKPIYHSFGVDDPVRKTFYNDLQYIIDFGSSYKSSNDYEAMLIMKYNIIEACTRLHAIKQIAPVFYYAIFDVNPNKPDPISTLRHGAVHHDINISLEEKLTFYSYVIKQLSGISQLHDAGTEVSANNMITNALAQPLAFPINFKASGDLFSRFENEAIVWHNEPVRNKMSSDNINVLIQARFDLIDSQVPEKASTMAIVELGEIFSQLRNNGSLEGISIKQKTVFACIDIRNAVAHGENPKTLIDNFLKNRVSKHVSI